MSDSVWPHRWQPIRLPGPWDSPGKNTGVGCHFLLQCLKVKNVSEFAQSCLTQRLHVLQPTRLLRPWDFPGKDTGVGCLPLPSPLFIDDEFLSSFLSEKAFIFPSFLKDDFSRYSSLNSWFFSPTLILSLLVWLLMGNLLKHISCPSLGYVLGFFQDFLCLLLSGDWVLHVQVYLFFWYLFWLLSECVFILSYIFGFFFLEQYFDVYHYFYFKCFSCSVIPFFSFWHWNLCMFFMSFLNCPTILGTLKLSF